MKEATPFNFSDDEELATHRQKWKTAYEQINIIMLTYCKVYGVSSIRVHVKIKTKTKSTEGV